MKSDAQELSRLIVGMRTAYARGENAMAWARANSGSVDNTLVSTLVAYDLQAGSYVVGTRSDPSYNNLWCEQIRSFIQPYLEPGDLVMEAGVGEATTLTGVAKKLDCIDITTFGFDVSLSRIRVAQEWAKENSINACLFVGDLFHIPMVDNAIDVIYTSHSLEPNGGKETLAITELLRVARKAVILVEPLYELASEDARKRMIKNGYVRGLKSAAEELGANVVEYGLLDVCANPLNPSGVVLMVKPDPSPRKNLGNSGECWQCPMTAAPLIDHGDLFYAEQVGIAYPVMRGVSLLRQEHAVVASNILQL